MDLVLVEISICSIMQRLTWQEMVDDWVESIGFREERRQSCYCQLLGAIGRVGILILHILLLLSIMSALDIRLDIAYSKQQQVQTIDQQLATTSTQQHVITCVNVNLQSLHAANMYVHTVYIQNRCVSFKYPNDKVSQRCSCSAV